MLVPHVQPQTDLSKSAHTPALRVASWNPNTLGKEDSLTWLFGSLHGHSPNIICFQETLLTAETAQYFTMKDFQIFHTPAASRTPSKGQARGLLTAVSLDLIAEPTTRTKLLDMGPDTEILTVKIKTVGGWYTINNVYIHQKANPTNLILNSPTQKCLTVGDFNSRHQEWEPLSRAPTSSPGMGNKLHTLIQTNPNVILVNTPRTPTTVDNTTLSLSLVSPDIAPASSWEVLLNCSSHPHFATLTAIQLEPLKTALPFSSRFIEKKANWGLFTRLTSEPVAPLSETSASDLEGELDSLIAGINKAAHKAIPKTKPHDKVKPWDCWWFNDDCKKANALLRTAVKRNLIKLPGACANLHHVRAQTIETYKQA